MRMQNVAFPHGGRQFNTLAQTGTTCIEKSLQSGSIIVNGTGADLQNHKAIQSRAKRKQISQALALSLAGIADEANNPKLSQRFWNTYHCLQVVQVANSRIHGKYCKNRICTVCNCIRKAEILNTYLKVIKTWPEPYFLTLTIKSVPARRLKALIKNILMGFNRILAKYKKRNQRGKGIRLIGIKSLECNFNPIKRLYNPHFHLIVYSKEVGEVLLAEWLTTPKKKGWTNSWAQNLTRITNHEKCLIEIVKYGSKIFTEPDVNSKSKQQTKRTIHAKALYTIIEAMEGLRIFDRFGFNLPKAKTVESCKTTLSDEYKEFMYDSYRADWVDVKSDLPLTEYIPDPKITHILKNCIDTQLN